MNCRILKAKKAQSKFRGKILFSSVKWDLGLVWREMKVIINCRVWAGLLPWLSLELRESTVKAALNYWFYTPTYKKYHFWRSEHGTLWMISVVSQGLLCYNPVIKPSGSFFRRQSTTYIVTQRSGCLFYQFQIIAFTLKFWAN